METRDRKVPLREFSLREAQEGEPPRLALGVALTYGTLIEGYMDVVTPGAFEDAIVPMIRAHMSPGIAIAMLENAGDDLRFEAEFIADNIAAKDARLEMAAMIEAGLTPEVSLGFRVLEYRSGQELTSAERSLGAYGAIDKAKARELSFVVSGAAPGAEVERLLDERRAEMAEARLGTYRRHRATVARLTASLAKGA